MPRRTAPRPHRRALILGAAALALPAPAAAAPAARLLDPAWRPVGQGGDPDAAPLGEFLARWRSMGPDGVARVDYGGALAAGARAPLAAWLAETQRVDPTALSPDAAMAWWINLYNAATLDLVLGAYPVSTIRKIRGGLFNTGPWGEKILSVNGVALSLDDVEHGILRPIWRDPRIHYAVNCASIGCPDLADRPWRAAGLSAQLDAAAEAYVNHPRGARMTGGGLVVSKIYDWFEADFGGDAAGVIAHLSRYARPPLAAALAGVDRIADAEYDWSLNDAA